MLFAEVDWLALGIILTLGAGLWVAAKVGNVIIGSAQGQGMILTLFGKLFK